MSSALFSHSFVVHTIDFELTGLQAVLFNTCISEARSLVQHLEQRVKGHKESSPNIPWLAISAILCFRRRIRSIVLPPTFMKLMWDSHPASDAHCLLSQLGAFLKDVDDCLKRAEDDIFLSRLALLHTTVLTSLRNAYVDQRGMHLPSRQLSPSHALLHWRVALRSMLHRYAHSPTSYQSRDLTRHDNQNWIFDEAFKPNLQVTVYPAPEACCQHAHEATSQDHGPVPHGSWSRAP